MLDTTPVPPPKTVLSYLLLDKTTSHAPPRPTKRIGHSIHFHHTKWTPPILTNSLSKNSTDNSSPHPSQFHPTITRKLNKTPRSHDI